MIDRAAVKYIILYTIRVVLLPSLHIGSSEGDILPHSTGKFTPHVSHNSTCSTASVAEDVSLNTVKQQP